jgi:hypothetical protein
METKNFGNENGSCTSLGSYSIGNSYNGQYTGLDTTNKTNLSLNGHLSTKAWHIEGQCQWDAAVRW